MIRADKDKWVSAMKDEMASLANNDVFTVERTPEDRKIVKCRWVFAMKRDSNGDVYRYKARLVAKGYSQVKELTIMRYSRLWYVSKL